MLAHAPLVPKNAAPAKASPEVKHQAFAPEETEPVAQTQFAYSLAGIQAFSAGEDPIDPRDRGSSMTASQYARGQLPTRQRLLAHHLPPLLLQPKLQIGAVDDPLEAEADRVAEQVMRMPDPTAATPGATPDVSPGRMVRTSAHDSANAFSGRSTAATTSDSKANIPSSAAATAVQRKCSCGGTCDKCKADHSGDEDKHNQDKHDEDKHGTLQRKPIAEHARSSSHTPAETHAQHDAHATTALRGLADQITDDSHRAPNPRPAPAISSVGPHAGGGRGMIAPPIVHEVLRSPGQPLDAATRAFFEPRFGYDFSRVRIHTDGKASESAKAVGARAYTVGTHVVVGDSPSSHGSHTTRRLIAHELVHVMQQKEHAYRHLTGSILGFLRRTPLKSLKSRLSAGELVKRAEEIFRTAAISHLRARHSLVTQQAIQSLKKELTVSVLQGLKNGELVTMVACNNPKFELLVQQALKRKEQLVPTVTLTSLNARSELPNKTGHAHAHAELPVSQEAQVEGLTDALVATSNLGCVDCISQIRDFSPNVTHVNPRTPSRGSVTPSGSVARPVTTTDVPIDPSAPYRRRRPPSGSPSVPTTGEINTTTQPAPLVSTGSPDRLGFAWRTAKSFALDTFRSLAITAVVDLAYTWLSYDKNAESPEEAQIRELYSKRVEPALTTQLQGGQERMREMATAHPHLDIYANITIDVDNTWADCGVGHNISLEQVTDMRFVDVGISFGSISFEYTIATGHDPTFISDCTNYRSTKRVVYSVPIDFGETPAERHRRILLIDASNAVSKGISARLLAGGTHFGGDPSSKDLAKEEQRKRFGQPSFLVEQSREDRKLLVKAYIEVTAINGPDDLYLDAINYLRELEQQDSKPEQSVDLRNARRFQH